LRVSVTFGILSDSARLLGVSGLCENLELIAH
jgi:hypothetical protein